MTDVITTTVALDPIASNDRQYWLDYRAALLSQVDAVERHRLNLSVTTADVRLWMDERGPPKATVVHQVAHIRECRKRI